jgi:hypothetical protein
VVAGCGERGSGNSWHPIARGTTREADSTVRDPYRVDVVPYGMQPKKLPQFEYRLYRFNFLDSFLLVYHEDYLLPCRMCGFRRCLCSGNQAVLWVSELCGKRGNRNEIGFWGVGL